MHCMDCCSRVITSRSLDCTDRDSRWWLQWAACSLVKLLLSNFIEAMNCMDEDAGGGLDMMSKLLDGKTPFWQIPGLGLGLQFP